MMPVDSLLAHNRLRPTSFGVRSDGGLLLIVLLAGHLRAGLGALFRHHGQGAGDRVAKRFQGDSSRGSGRRFGADGALGLRFQHASRLQRPDRGVLSGDSGKGRSARVASPSLRRDAGRSIPGRSRPCVRLLPAPDQGLGQGTPVLSSGTNRGVGLPRPRINLPGRAASDAGHLLDGDPGNGRYADLRVALHRFLISRPEPGFSEMRDGIALLRQLQPFLGTDGGDWYLRMNHSFILGRLGDDEASRRALLQAMVRMPLYAQVYQDHAALPGVAGDTVEALHYGRIAGKFKDAQGLEAMIRRLEDKSPPVRVGNAFPWEVLAIESLPSALPGCSKSGHFLRPHRSCPPAPHHPQPPVRRGDCLSY